MTCPFCCSERTTKIADFGTSLMVDVHQCDDCHSYFEAIKWSGHRSPLDVPAFLDERIPKP
jgi:hypothetical protein